MASASAKKAVLSKYMKTANEDRRTACILAIEINRRF